MIILFLAHITGIVSYAQQFAGKWQEIKRWAAKDSAVNFIDTFRISFIGKDSIKYQQKGVLPFIGSYKAAGNVIVIEDAVRIVVASKGKNELLIIHEGFKRQMVPVANFSDERTQYDSVFINYGNKVDTSVLSGKWIVYKREGPLPEKGYMMMKHIRFSNEKGELSRYNWEGAITDNITYHINNNMLIVRCGSYINIFKILKAQADEMILKDEILSYYLKPAR